MEHHVYRKHIHNTCDSVYSLDDDVDDDNQRSDMTVCIKSNLN